MRPFESILRLLPTGHLGRWRRQYALPFGLTMGTVLGVVLTLAVTHLVSPDPGLEQGDLVILSSRDDSAGHQRQVLIDQWNATHPGNPAKIVELPIQGDAAHSELVARAQSGKTDVDIYNLDLIWTAEFAHARYIRPLDESSVDLEGFLSKPIETCFYEGKLWALPFNTDAGLLYYRTDLVPQPPPTSWRSLSRTAEEVLAKSNHDPRLQAGYAGQLAGYEGLTVNALEAIQAEVVDNGKVTIDFKDLREGIDQLRSSVVLRESLEYDEERSIQAFRDGKVLFMRHWPYAYRVLSPPAGGESAGPPMPFDVAPLPGGGVLGGQNLAIAATSTEPKAAQALIKFLTDARSQQILFERGGFAATRKVVYQDAEVRKRYPYVPVLLTAIENAMLRPVTPCYSMFSEVFQTTVHQALREARPLPRDFIDTLKAALNC